MNDRPDDLTTHERDEAGNTVALVSDNLVRLEDGRERRVRVAEFRRFTWDSNGQSGFAFMYLRQTVAWSLS